MYLIVKTKDYCIENDTVSYVLLLNGSKACDSVE